MVKLSKTLIACTGPTVGQYEGAPTVKTCNHIRLVLARA